MTEYIRFLNFVKENCDKSWLTPSQRIVYDKVIKGYKNHRVVNIFGREGFGKTFLGWVFEKDGYGKYFVSLESITGNKLGTVIIDNFPSDRENHRRFRSNMGNWGITKAIVITQYSIPDDIPIISVDFTDEDRKRFKHNCYDKLRLQIKNERVDYNMHDLLKKNIWMWSDD